MGIQYASRVVRMFGDPDIAKIDPARHDHVIDAVMNESLSYAARAHAICGEDLQLNELSETHLSTSIAALLIGHVQVAHEILPFIHSELSRRSNHWSWEFVPATVIGCLDAITWLDKQGASAQTEFNTELPVFVGIMLRKYGKWTPQQDALGHAASQWAIGRFADLMANYTLTPSPDENMRRISIIVGKMSEYSGSFPKCTHPFIAQVSYRAMKFVSAGEQIKAMHSILNADRIVPKDDKAT